MTLLEPMAACTREARSEGKHKLGQTTSTSRQHKTTISTLTNELTASAFGKQDRDRPTEVSQDSLRQQKLNSICSHTCAELRMQRNSTDLLLHSLKVEVDHETNNNTTWPQRKSNLVQTEVGCLCVDFALRLCSGVFG